MIPRIIAHLAQNHFGQCNMKMQTAIKQIQKECDFMGLGFVEVFETFVTTKNMMSGKEFQERYDTPYYCSPRSESFWSM